MAHVLIVDDEEKIRVLLKIMLMAKGHKVYQADNGRSALEVLESQSVDLVISDICMDDIDGLGLLLKIREQELGCPVIFITAYATLDSAVEALRLGAVDYLTKPFEERDVILAVERALGVRKILSENILLRQRVADKETAALGVFVSSPMLKVCELAKKVAQSEATVLLTGESGTGKEVIARYIYQSSPRRDSRFVAMNCAAIATNLLEAELFGHQKGAFTGADKSRAGKFEFASGGVLFLDEIGELSLEAQAKLLRAIQEKSVQRVGGNQDIPVDCRLICATNRDLAALVQEGKFREDLFYRLAVFPLELPPLRERRADIIPLVLHCMEKLGVCQTSGDVLTPAAQELLQNYSWPGNVRELFNVVERTIIMKGKERPFSSDDFAHLGWQERVNPLADDKLLELPATGINYEEMQRSIVRQSLQIARGNQSAAARLLGVSRAKFRTLLGLLEGDENKGKVVIKFSNQGYKSNDSQ